MPTEAPTLTPTIDRQATRIADATRQAEFSVAVQTAVEGTLAALPSPPSPTVSRTPTPRSSPTVRVSPTLITATPVEIALRRTVIDGLGLEFDYPAEWRAPNQLTPFTAVGMPTVPDGALIIFVRGQPEELVEAGVFSSTRPAAVLEDVLYGIESTITETDRFDDPAWEATGQDDSSAFHYYLIEHGAEWVFMGSQVPLQESEAVEGAIFEPLVASLTIGTPPLTPTPRPTLTPFVPTPLPTLTPMRFEVTVTRAPTRTPRVTTATPSAVPPTVTPSPAGPTPDLFATATAIVREATRAGVASPTRTAIPPSPVVTSIPVTPTRTLYPAQITGTAIIANATGTAAAREQGTLPPSATIGPAQFTATAIIANATATAAVLQTAEPSATPDLDATATAIVSQVTATAAALAEAEFPLAFEVPEGWADPARRDANTVFLTDGTAQVFVYAGERDELRGLWQIPDDVTSRDEAADRIAQRLGGLVARHDNDNVSLILIAGDETRGAVYLITLPDGDLAVVSANVPADEFEDYRAEIFEPLVASLAARRTMPPRPPRQHHARRGR